MKKGQISIFMVLGVVILLVIGLVFYISGKGYVANVPPDVEVVRGLIDSCVEYSGKEGILLVGLLGGYDEIGEEVLGGYVPYYYDKGNVHIPDMRLIEQSISKRVYSEVVDCVDLSEFNFETEISRPVVEVSVKGESVDVIVDYDVVLKIDGREYNLDEPYVKSYGVKLREVYEFVVGVIGEIEDDPEYLEVDYLLGGDYNIVLNYYSDAIMFTLTDFDSVIDEEKFVFKFGARYLQE